MTAGGRARRPLRLLVAGLLAIVTGCGVSLIMHRNAAAHDSTNVLLAAQRLERLVADLETGQLRFLATGDSTSLSPWHAARAAFPAQAAALQRLAAEISPEQARRAQEIIRAATSYLREHAEPMVRAVRHDPRRARSLVTRAEGKRRIDAIRRQFDRFLEVQHGIASAREKGAVPAARRMIATAAGAAGSLLVLFLLAGFVMHGPWRRGGDKHADHQPAVVPSRLGGHRSRTEDEHEALRRIATLVARGASPAEVGNAAAGEMGRILGAEHAMITRYDPAGMVRAVGYWNDPDAPAIMPPLDGRWPVANETVADRVRRSGRPARMPSGFPGTGDIGRWIRSHKIRQMIGCPVVAGEDLWGVATVLSRTAAPHPGAAEQCMLEFAGLIGLAVANARHQAELAASRVRLVEASDAARSRIERDLHDRTQQRLVAVGLRLRAAEATVPHGMEEFQAALARTAGDVTGVIEDLQEIARRLYPAFLMKGGLDGSLRALARRSPVRVELETDVRRRVPANIALTVHFVVAEGLANAAEHAHASTVWVGVRADETVRLTVRDDGIGGAWPRPGSALTVLRDRVDALGGALEIESPPGEGTSLRLTIEAGEE
jgi:signal transduction histidine kinase/CHASE3 domain sensor protein